MSDFNLENAVQDTVDELVNERKAFTAYEVTQTVRSANHSADVPTLTSRDLVHGMYRDGFMPGYTRERAVDVKGSPWRYSPPDVIDDDLS